MSKEVLDAFLSGFSGQVQQPERPAIYPEYPPFLSPSLERALAKHGIPRLYRHQALAYELAHAGHDVMQITGTGSGKSLAYFLRTLQVTEDEPAARALYLYPTKALAQDQLAKLAGWLPEGVRAATYDGDTPKNQRSAIRNTAHVVVSNVDMLHVGILPGHEAWTRFLRSLRLIVIDELHAYRGVFGSHVGQVLRRLLRLAESTGTRPQILAGSATIANPVDLFAQLTGREVTAIDQDGSPQGERTHAFWAPAPDSPFADVPPTRASAMLAHVLAESGMRCLVFSRSRVGAEVVLRHLRNLDEQNPDRYESYRGGYTAKERRAIEKRFFRGEIRALSATNALELGIDVGQLDAVIMNGFPSTISAYWQQAGRAGRAGKPGLSIVVVHADPMERFLARDPLRTLAKLPEAARANPGNPLVLGRQLLCAAYERPLSAHEMDRFGPTGLEAAEQLDRGGELVWQAGRFYYPAYEPPAKNIDLRGTGGPRIRLMVGGEELGEMELSRALTSAHAGAIYLHRGESYVVEELDLMANLARLRPEPVDYFTQAVMQAVIQDNVSLGERPCREGRVRWVGVTVTEQVIGYRRRGLKDDTASEIIPLELPPQSFDTSAVRLEHPGHPGQDWEERSSAVHGVEHAVMAMAPIWAACDRGDLGSAWFPLEPETLGAAVYVYDRAPGGVGLTDALFAQADEWLNDARDLLANCPCAEGCPECLLSLRCEVRNELLSKAGALALLTDLQMVT